MIMNKRKIVRFKRSFKSPLLRFTLLIGVSFLGLTAAAVFPLIKKQDTIAGDKDIFDNSHYLFANSEGVSNNSVLCLNVNSGTVLEPLAPSFLIKGRTFGSLVEEEYFGKTEIQEYIVQEGDTLKLLSEKFNISLETLLLANELNKNSALKQGQKLLVLPVSGIMHIVSEGDSISELAQLYQVNAEDIIDFNELEDQNKICAGDILVIPGAQKPKVQPQYATVPLSNSYFICPIPAPCKITQGLHWFNAVDFGNGGCGEPVFAAAGGIVQRAGYLNDAGNYVRILHPNGVVTFYGHLSKITALVGEKVSQGQIIGYVGHTGITVPQGSEGCHLHFDVRFAVNPFAK